jgi:patatin-related protein
MGLLGYDPPPVVDVITGTSAGGINAAALALAQANSSGDLEILKHLWIRHGQIGDLFRGPFKSGPPSLLRGDDYFYPQIQFAFRQLTKDYTRATKRAPSTGDTPTAEQASDSVGVRPIDLTITATLLTPVQMLSVDDLGTAMTQPQHAGLFQFRGGFARNAADTGPGDVFAVEELPRTVDALALAARATAGFPVAFEPTFVPVLCQTGCPDDRPDMVVFADWARTDTDMSRFAVDGGVLANTPTKPALAGIRRQEVASTLTRRVLILVHPHATYATTKDIRERPDIAATPPTLVDGLTGVLKAASSVGSKTYVEEIQAHNEEALRSRDGRLATLVQFNPNTLAQFLCIEGVPQPAWQLLRAMRKRRAARVLAIQIRDGVTTPFSKLIEYASDVLTEEDGTDGLPFLPPAPPSDTDFEQNNWRWGLDFAVGITALVTDLLRALLSNPAAIPEMTASGAEFRNVVLAEARRAWTVAANGGVSLWAIGATEIADRGAPAENGSTETDSTNGRPEGEVIRERLRTGISKYRSRMCPREGASDVESDGARVLDIMLGVSEALLRVTALLDTDDARAALANQPQSASVTPRLTASLLENSNPLRRQTDLADPDRQNVLKRMVEVELISYLLAEHSVTENEGPTTPIEFVQLSAQVKQDFATGFSSDDKLAGMSLNRFGAFLKRSWRANDWIWGRLDAIKIVMLILLTPEIIRGLSRTPEGQLSAEHTVDLITNAAFADHADHRLFQAGSALHDLRKNAIEEVTRAIWGGKEPVPDPPADPTGSDEPLSELASLAAYGLQMTTVIEDLPWLAETIRDDVEDGATGIQTAGFLHRYNAPKEPKPNETYRGYQLLGMFARSGIGQEALAEQLPSDLMIRTVATAAATAVSAVNSEKSGLGIARPLTKLAHGAIALPYWALVGLTHRGQLARAVAATVLALGVSLIALALLAPLPGLLAAIVPTVGIASLATILAYAALRMQSIVHGAALLGIFVPLVSFGAYRWLREDSAAPTPDAKSGAADAVDSLLPKGGATLVIVTVGLLLLWVVVVANIRTHTRSPMRVIVTRSHQIVAYVKKYSTWLLGGLALLIAAGATIWYVREDIPQVYEWLRGAFNWVKEALRHAPWKGEVLSWVTLALVVVAVVSGIMAYYKSRRFMPATITGEPKNKSRILVDPAGLATAWAPVYGALYIFFGVVMIPLVGANAPGWAVAASIVMIVIGLGFCLVAVHRIPALRERKMVRRLASYLVTNSPSSKCEEWSSAIDSDWVEAFAKIGDSPAYLFNTDGLSWHGKRVKRKAIKYERPAA